MPRRITFHTTWSEISVGVRICHGHGSRHVTWVKDQRSWWPFGKHEEKSKGLAVRASTSALIFPGGRIREPEIRCAISRRRSCARRSRLADCAMPGEPTSKIGSPGNGCLPDTQVVADFSHGLFFADGQMEDEVYNYGSFGQSKMFAAAGPAAIVMTRIATNLKWRATGFGLQCHSSDKYATVAANHHEAVSLPVGCPACHMPTRTYMVVDPRHDHSLVVPRPDPSTKIGTPNACNVCHKDKSAEWARPRPSESWYGAESGSKPQTMPKHSMRPGRSNRMLQRFLGAVAAGPKCPGGLRARAH